MGKDTSSTKPAGTDGSACPQQRSGGVFTHQQLRSRSYLFELTSPPQQISDELLLSDSAEDLDLGDSTGTPPTQR
jgi:hypothetical protein